MNGDGDGGFEELAVEGAETADISMRLYFLLPSTLRSMTYLSTQYHVGTKGKPSDVG